MLVVIGVLSNNSIKGGAATRALTTAISNLSKPTKEAQTALDSLNVKAYDAQGKFVGLENVFKQVYIATKDLSDKQRDAALATIFGNESLAEAQIILQSIDKDARGAAGGFNDMERDIITLYDDILAAVDNQELFIEA